jgi:hypothetical protein
VEAYLLARWAPPPLLASMEGRMQQRDLAATFADRGIDVASLRPLFHFHDHVVYVLTVPPHRRLTGGKC